MSSECPKCGKELKTETGMKSHYAQVHNGSLRGRELSCENCGNNFRKLDCRIDRDSHHTCSDECRAELVGELQSGEDNPRWVEPEYKTCKNCGEEFNYKKVRGRGVYCSTECKGADYSNRLKGENNPNYQGGSRPGFTENERTEVYDRDDYTCQDCGQIGGRLNAHHIEAVPDNPELAHEIDNGITLCMKCHAYRHEGESIFSAMMANIEP